LEQLTVRYRINLTKQIILDTRTAFGYDFGKPVEDLSQHSLHELCCPTDAHRTDYTERDALATVFWLNQRELNYP